MNILLFGASGMLGQVIHRALAPRHQISTVGSKSGDIQVDMSDPPALRDFFAKRRGIDAIVSAAGSVAFNAVTHMTDDEWRFSLDNKLMGQINLVRYGVASLAPGGSITLVTGVLAQDPIRQGVAASTVNGALESFVLAAAIELPDGKRINAVSPGVLQESAHKYGDFFPGHKPVPGSDVATAFVKSVEGAQTGQVYRVV